MRNYKDYLPTRKQLRNVKTLRILGEVIFEPNLWHFNRHSVSFAALVGIFCMFLPIPFQMIPCTLLCIYIRCNIPLAIALVWVSNPITIPPIFYFAYEVGTWFLGDPTHLKTVDLSLRWFASEFVLIWQPLLLGSLLCGAFFGGAAFALIRIYWRWRVVRNWGLRGRLHRQRRKKE